MHPVIRKTLLTYGITLSLGVLMALLGNGGSLDIARSAFYLYFGFFGLVPLSSFCLAYSHGKAVGAHTAWLYPLFTLLVYWLVLGATSRRGLFILFTMSAFWLTILPGVVAALLGLGLGKLAAHRRK